MAGSRKALLPTVLIVAPKATRVDTVVVVEVLGAVAQW